jgi:hypothetical protein
MTNVKTITKLETDAQPNLWTCPNLETEHVFNQTHKFEFAHKSE